MTFSVRPGVLVLLAVLMAGCGGPDEQTAVEPDDDAPALAEPDAATLAEPEVRVTPEPEPDVTVSPLPENAEPYDDAALSLNQPQPEASMPPGEVTFDFNVEGFVLGAETPDWITKGLANSPDGQHIHLILNNEPYSAHYEPSFSEELEPGHYTMLAFLSRSYHESIKHDAAKVLLQFDVGDGASSPVDLTTPHLFYSRPKGTYVGADAASILLDFYLVNAELAENGYRVRASIDGKPFMLDEWRAYVIEGLLPGEVTIRLELLDSTGNLVDSPFNPVERVITVEAGNQQNAD